MLLGQPYTRRAIRTRCLLVFPSSLFRGCLESTRGCRCLNKVHKAWHAFRQIAQQFGGVMPEDPSFSHSKPKLTFPLNRKKGTWCGGAKSPLRLAKAFASSIHSSSIAARIPGSSKALVAPGELARGPKSNNSSKSGGGEAKTIKLDLRACQVRGAFIGTQPVMAQTGRVSPTHVKSTRGHALFGALSSSRWKVSTFSSLLEAGFRRPVGTSSCKMWALTRVCSNSSGN